VKGSTRSYGGSVVSGGNGAGEEPCGDALLNGCAESRRIACVMVGWKRPPYCE